MNEVTAVFDIGPPALCDQKSKNAPISVRLRVSDEVTVKKRQVCSAPQTSFILFLQDSIRIEELRGIHRQLPRRPVVMVSGGSHFRYSDEVRNLVLVQLAAGVRPSEIANALGVSKPFISQVKARSEMDPEMLRRAKRPRGRPPKLPSYAVEAVRDHVTKRPKCERGEVVEMLRERFGVEVHPTTTGRLIKKLKKELSEATSSTPIAGQTSGSQQTIHRNSTQNSNNTSH